MKRDHQKRIRRVEKHSCDSSVPCSMSSDGNHWDTHKLYQCNYNPFDVEWIKFFNPVEGRDQIIFLYRDKETKKIVKHRILR